VQKRCAKFWTRIFESFR